MTALFTPRLQDIIRDTHRSLLDRIEPDGYAATSLTGAYPGMYARDSAIHAMALLRTGHTGRARAILWYIAGHSALLELQRAPQVLLRPDSTTSSFSVDLQSGGGRLSAEFDSSRPIAGVVLECRDPFATANVTVRNLTSGQSSQTRVKREEHNVRPLSRIAPSASIQDARYQVHVSVPGDAGLTGAKLRVVVAQQDRPIMLDQPDGNYMFVLAWARYVVAQPNDIAFITDTLPVVAAFADYYLTPTYWDEERNLLRNPCLEHSRNLRFWSTLDLITNVFLSQALHELAYVTQEVLPTQAQRWRRISEQVRSGIDGSLVAKSPRGSRQYAELIDRDHGDKFYVGYSWVNFATIAANWYASDSRLERETYDAYLEEASSMWGDHRMLRAYDDVVAATGEDEVIGKGLAWEIRLAQKLGRADRVRSLLAFIEERTPGTIFAESYYPHHVSDGGNQEQAAWFIHELACAFPADIARLCGASNSNSEGTTAA